ncbi:hypothetical protein PV-S19_0317 [Pacmanvirus S19]|nr:hypothetical protein PV-S19_0317 [Pacmanvirus S19]
MSTVTLSGFTIAKPASAVTAVAGTTSGSLDQEVVYGYKVSYVTGFGETDLSDADTVTTTTTGSVSLSDIPVSSDGNVIARRIYRTAGGATTYLLLTELSDNTTTTYVDTAADADLGAAAPTVNLAHSFQVVNGMFKVSKPTMYSVERNITAGAGGTSLAAYQLSSEYNIIATVTTINDSVKLPALSAELIGAHIRIRNTSANAARIYPFDGQTIDDGSADAAITVAADTSVDLIADQADNWTQV